MEWWQYLIVSLTSVAVGAALGYVVSGEERKSRESDQLKAAVRGLLAEVEANLKLATVKSGDETIWPFFTDMWNVYRGYIVLLSNEERDRLYDFYVDVQRVNHVVQLGLVQGGRWGSAYRTEREKIATSGSKVSQLLVAWLNRSNNWRKD